MSNGCLRLELSDTGSRIRVGDMKGRTWASTGKSTFKVVTVSLIWSVRMVHSISVAAQDRLRGDWDGGTR
jgi:hypothetical protein